MLNNRIKNDIMEIHQSNTNSSFKEEIMTDFNRVRGYYNIFNEDERLMNDNSGRLEFEMTMKKLQKHLPESATILDLGGATGVYTFPLAEKGYKMYLADLSET